MKRYINLFYSFGTTKDCYKNGINKMTGSGSYLYTQDSSPVIMVFMKSGSLFVKSSIPWVYGYDLETKSFHHFIYNENPTRTQHYITQMLLANN